MDWTSYKDGLASLFEQGGLILWAILIASVYMWFLLAERYWFHWKQIPQLRDRLRKDWLDHPISLSSGIAYRRISARLSNVMPSTRNRDGSNSTST